MGRTVICRRCGQSNALVVDGAAADAAEQLVAKLEAAAAHPRRDRSPIEGPRRPWGGPGPVFDPLDDARPLFEPRGGKMFGVLVAEDTKGEAITAFAFSGMYAGRWVLPGWAPPLFDPAQWYRLEATYDPEIKAASSRAERAERSAALMRRYHELYRLPNAAGAVTDLFTLFGDTPVPSGAGDCCAPKLLAWARAQRWRPRAVGEVYVGAPNRANTRHHGELYAPCEEKCGPLMGFLLCDCPPQLTA